MDIKERIEMLHLCEISDEVAYQDLLTIVKVFQGFDITLTEENAGIMIAHIAAAFQRNRTGETIKPLIRSIVQEIEEDNYFEKCEKIFKIIKNSIHNQLSSREEEFVLLHICTLLNNLEEVNE